MRHVVWFRRFLTAAAAAAMLAGGAASARPQDEGAQVLEQIAEQFRRGIYSKEFEDWFQSEQFMDLARKRPADFRKVCAAAEEGRSRLAIAETEKARGITTRLVECATACAGENPESADAVWSLALARLVRGRTERDGSGAPDPEDWTESATLLEKAWGLQADEGRGAGEAVQALFECAKLPKADAAALTKRADELLERASAKHPDSGPLLRVWAGRTIERATTLFATKKADATALVDGALKRLAPAAQKKDPDLDVATAYNSLVAFLLDRKVATRADFVTRTSQCGTLEMKVPVSRCFRVDDSGTIHQFTASNEAVRSFTFDSYKWDTEYDFGMNDNPGGDNAKGIASADFSNYKFSLKKTTSAKDVSKGRLNGRIAGAYYWEVVGTRKDEAKDERARCWFFKSEKGHMVTYALRVFEWDMADMDAAGKSVLDSITERGK